MCKWDSVWSCYGTDLSADTLLLLGVSPFAILFGCKTMHAQAPAFLPPSEAVSVSGVRSCKPETTLRSSETLRRAPANVCMYLPGIARHCAVGDLAVRNCVGTLSCRAEENNVR